MIFEINRTQSEQSVSDEQLNALAMSFYYTMLEFFSSEKGKAEFEEYLEKKNENAAA